MERLFKVLVVDDVKSVRLLIQQKLNELGITQISMAGNGVEALELLSNEPDIDVILCDWHMEQMDGLRFCAQVQRLPYIRGRRIPVVFMTCDDRLVDPEKRSRTLESARGIGIVDVLMKPFTIDDLKSALARCAQFEPQAPARKAPGR